MERDHPKGLKDFPKFLVTGVRHRRSDAEGHCFELEGSIDPILEKSFDEMAQGIGPQWCWLLFDPRGSLCVTLDSFAKEKGSAIFTCEASAEPPDQGMELAFLSSYWQAFHVWMVLDPGWGWRREQFRASDAIAEDFVAEDVSMIGGQAIRNWTKLQKARGDEGQAGSTIGDPTSPARPGARLLAGAWDHEHCELCDEHIDPGMFGYKDPEGMWVCDRCYQKYVALHDLAFVDEL